jgi:hypothetical protein
VRNKTAILTVNLFRLRIALLLLTIYWFSILSVNGPINSEVIFHIKTLLLYDDMPRHAASKSPPQRIVGETPDFTCILSYGDVLQ